LKKCIGFFNIRQVPSVAGFAQHRLAATPAIGGCVGDAVNAFELPQPRRSARATENRLNIARPFFGGEFVAPIAFSDSFDAAIDFGGFDDGGF
jgi:hypothetical protein